MWTFVTQTDTIHSLHPGKSHQKKKRSFIRLEGTNSSSPAWSRALGRFENCDWVYGTELLQDRQNMKEVLFDWVTVFNREDNPCEHGCETFLICATLKLCHSYWRVFALNRRYRTVNRNTSKEICYFYVSLKTEMTMWLIWKLNRK